MDLEDPGREAFEAKIAHKDTKRVTGPYYELAGSGFLQVRVLRQNQPPLSKAMVTQR